VPPRRSSLERDLRVLEAALAELPAPQAVPALVVLSGLPGSGKSYLVAEICRRYPLARLESDSMRKVLFSRPVYSQRESGRLFTAIHALLEILLARGIPSILDATNLKIAHRQPIYDIAKRHGAKLIIVETIAPDAVVRRRMAARLAGENLRDHSDAGIDVYETMRREAEPIEREHLVVDTSGGVQAIIDKIARELKGAAN
jgi:predicted kinase